VGEMLSLIKLFNGENDLFLQHLLLLFCLVESHMMMGCPLVESVFL
jgi:hypothetical protein